MKGKGVEDVFQVSKERMLEAVGRVLSMKVEKAGKRKDIVWWMDEIRESIR